MRDPLGPSGGDHHFRAASVKHPLPERAAVRDPYELARSVETYLACPRCHASVVVRDGQIRCGQSECGFASAITGGIPIMRGQLDRSFFDDKHAVMEHGSAEPGVRRCCYAEQAAVIEALIPGKAVVVDVGCGPALSYQRPKSSFLIGVDMSYESLCANTEVDLAVYASAGELPMADGSVDAIVSLYAIHHFGGQNRRENEARVARGFAEFRRVLKPGASLLIFELSPWWPIWQVQRTAWDLVRKLMPAMDIFFWRERALLDVAARHFGGKATLRRVRFKAPLMTPIPPVFACPALKIPRLLFPFHVNLYHWTV